MALNQNFFPKTYKTLQMVEGSLKAAEKQFDLRDWIAPFLIEEFGIKTVEKAVKNLQLSFWELCDYKTVSSRSPQMLAYYPVNLIHRQEVVTKWENVPGSRHPSRVEFKEYSLKVPSHSFGDIFDECLTLKFPQLKQFTREEEIVFNPAQLFAGATFLMRNVPKEFRGWSLNKLSNLTEPQTITREVCRLSGYTPSHSDLSKYDIYFDTCEKADEDELNTPSLYVPYFAFKNRDFEPVIERMKSYFKSYGKNEADYQKALRVLEKDIVKNFRAQFFNN